MNTLTIRQQLLMNYLAVLFMEEKKTILAAPDAAQEMVVNSFMVLDVAAASGELSKKISEMVKTGKGGES